MPGKKKALSGKKQEELWLKELQENKSLQEYLKQYSDISVKCFMDYYIRQKNYWLMYGTDCAEKIESDRIKWVDKAAEHLKIIQQKKLFDLQCKWRAEEIIIDGLSLGVEFSFWEKDIMNCPFLEPVNKEDVDIYMAYLSDPNQNIEELGEYDSFDWQDYGALKEAYNDSPDAYTNFPDWYAYVNVRKGTNMLMLLPDTRGEKEEFYMNICRKRRHEKYIEDGGQESVYDKRPELEYLEDDDKTLEWVVKTFESKEVREAFEGYKWKERGRDMKEYLEYDLQLLFSADEKVPIESNEDWVDAVSLAAERYRRRKIAEALPEAFEQYKMNIDMGIGFPKEKNDPWLVELHKEMILEGRVLNGEPENLDF